MIPREFEAITKADIEALVANVVAEGRTIEYKQQLPGNGDEDKREFLADISSFANASGGDMLYGIVEKRDGNKATGIPDSIAGLEAVNASEQILRMEQTIASGIEPRIPGIRIRSITGFDSGPILIVRVPKSWAAPHMVTFKNLSRFFARNSAGKYQLDVTEIRSAFTASGDLRAKIAEFRLERLSKIIANETPVRLTAEPKMILHLVPFTILDPTIQLDLQQLSDDPNLTRPIRASSHRQRFNIDGFLSHDLNFYEDKPTDGLGYLQVFRTGPIEAVAALSMMQNSTGKLIQSSYVEQIILESAKKYAGVAKRLTIALPIVLMVTMHGFKGYGLARNSQYLEIVQPHRTIDRDTLLLPDVLLEDFSTSIDKLIRPIFDALWQSAGFTFCENYDGNGNWDGGKARQTMGYSLLK